MHFIALQGTYSSLSLGLFQGHVAEYVAHFDELRASSNLIPLLEEFLKQHNVALDQLDFIAVDKGPGAFTSLRATIASVNGIAFGRKVPLIGINSLEALQHEARKSAVAADVRYIVSLLNAYNNDAYFRIFDQQEAYLIDEGCKNIDLVTQQLVALGQSMLCIGNGATLYAQELRESLESTVRFMAPVVEVPSVVSIGECAFAAWQQHGLTETSYAIEPYYLKTQLFAIKK
jgi:tRNA threonylcarbamoyladenosine biosynthesis protein TsaB